KPGRAAAKVRRRESCTPTLAAGAASLPPEAARGPAPWGGPASLMRTHAMTTAVQPSPLAGRAASESGLTRWLLIGTALAFLTVFLFLPLAFVFVTGLQKGFGVYVL